MTAQRNRPNFEDVSKRVAARLRPGIIEAVDDYDYEVFKVNHLDTSYKGQRIGSNMEVLVNTGVAEILNEDRTGEYDYRLREDDLEPVMDKAEDAFRYRIISLLDNLEEDAAIVADDLEDKGLREDYDGGALAHFRNGDYSDVTLGFLADLSMIESETDRTFISDQRDLDYLEENIGEWRAISDSLLQKRSLPMEYFREKQGFP